jgi:hypothetical protein
VTRTHARWIAAVSCLFLFAACPATTKRAALGDWSADVEVGPSEWAPGQRVTLGAEVSPPSGLARFLAANGHSPRTLVCLITAERAFDPDGWLRLPSDENMSTLLTPTGLPIEGGVQGPVTDRFGYAFKTPVDVLLERPFTSWPTRFETTVTLPADLPPGLYRVRFDFGVRTEDGILSLYGGSLGSRPFRPARGSYLYSRILPASGVDARGRAVDASALQARVPFVLLGRYNSNGYQGVVADEDRARFNLSSRNIIQDDVILPLYGGDGNWTWSYDLEPTLPFLNIDPYSNLDWDFTKGELSLEIDNPDGSVTTVPATRIVGKSDDGYPTTRNPAFTAWRPPAYGQYTVKLSGWIADRQGRRYQGGGTYHFWIAKRMTMATATFQGNAYAVGYKYGRDMAFNPPLPADVTMTATLYPGSDPAQARTVTSSGRATRGGIFGAAQGMVQLTLDAPGEYCAHVLARATDAEGHLWVSSMRHAGVVYAADSPIEAHGKKLWIGNTWVERGNTNREGWHSDSYEGSSLEHIAFPYRQSDVLLIASDGGGANKIEPVLVWANKGEDMPWDWSLAGIGTTNLAIRTSNGLSPHLFPEYITDREYYYASAARPGFMPRFLVGESNVRAPYWSTSPNYFGGQIAASGNGDLPGDLYRLIGGVVKLDQGQAPAYAGYLASAAILPRGTRNNRVVEPGAEDLIGPTGEKARFFLVGYRPGMALPVGAGWRPAIQVDPQLPVNIHLVLTFPDGSTQTVDGVPDASGSFAGPTAYPLTQAGLYRYQLSASWNGHEGRMPGLPDAGGEFYVYTDPRPAGATGLQIDLPNQSYFPASGPLVVKGRSTAATVRYALIMPGAVLKQADVAVVGGEFTLSIDPAELHRLVPIYDTHSVTDGHAMLGRVLHLTFLSEEAAPDGSRFWDFHRVVVRGNQALSAWPVSEAATRMAAAAGARLVLPHPVLGEEAAAGTNAAGGHPAGIPR